VRTAPAEVVDAAHQRAAGAHAEEQVVHQAERFEHGRRGVLLVRRRIARIRVLVEPEQIRLDGQPVLDVGDPGPEIAAVGVPVADDHHFRAERTHARHGRRVGVRIRHADQPILLGRADDRERDPEIARGGLDQRGARQVRSGVLRRLDQAARCFDLDRAARVEALDLQKEPIQIRDPGHPEEHVIHNQVVRMIGDQRLLRVRSAKYSGPAHPGAGGKGSEQ